MGFIEKLSIKHSVTQDPKRHVPYVANISDNTFPTELESREFAFASSPTTPNRVRVVADCKKFAGPRVAIESIAL